MEKKHIILFMLIFLQPIFHGDNTLTLAQQPRADQVVAICRNTGNFKSDSVHKHRDSALDLLSSNLSVPEFTGFKSTRSGGDQPGDAVNAIMLCPPKIKVERCQDCIKKSVPILKQKCPKQKEAAIWTILGQITSCMVRYADYRIEKRYDDWAWVNFSSPQTTNDKWELDNAILGLTNKLKEQAAGDVRKFVAGNLTYGKGWSNVYVALQCTPDISKDECMTCLDKATYGVRDFSFVKGKMSGRVLSTNCYVRYDHKNFQP